ncbi:unnamed protein product [Pleuronectes platessa]|uniref:Uncharacterized protein n=1 Tax=Pleuronectes platessa TaxID=8262 RepID=A0A9N7YK30_PLEPL|nr:unnamed protein product [Pleuronectes platessa]
MEPDRTLQLITSQLESCSLRILEKEQGHQILTGDADLTTSPPSNDLSCCWRKEEEQEEHCSTNLHQTPAPSTREHQDQQVHHWSLVLLTDESWFTLSSCDRDKPAEWSKTPVAEQEDGDMCERSRDQEVDREPIRGEKSKLFQKQGEDGWNKELPAVFFTHYSPSSIHPS